MKTSALIFLLNLSALSLCYGQSKKETIADKRLVTVGYSSHLTSPIERDVTELKKQNTELRQLVQQQNKQMQGLVSTLNTNKPGVLELWIYPIALSIIAAIIFWFAFSYLPERKRKKELRPKIEAELDALKLQLFFFIDKPLWVGKHYGSLSQHKITTGTLTKDEIQLALYNKCISKKYLYDPVVANMLITIGQELYEGVKKIDEQIEHLFLFSHLLSSKEILLLEKIRQTTQKYDFSDPEHENVGTLVGNQLLLPVYPSMTYRFENFYECLALYKELQQILHITQYGQNILGYEIVSVSFYQGKYKQCQKQIAKYFKEDPTNHTYWILSEFLGGNKEKSYEYLETRLNKQDRHSLVSDRTLYKHFINDDKGLSIINKLSKPGELDMLLKNQKEEDTIKSNFENTCLFIKNYYKWKSNNVGNGKIYNPSEHIA